MTISQDNRLLKIKFPGPDKDSVVLIGMQAEEQVSKSYNFRLEILSDEEDIDANDVVGKGCGFSVGLADDKLRHFHGVVWRFGPSESVMGLEDAVPMRIYRAEVVPWLKLLSLYSDSRIFQEKTVPQIVEQVFKDRGFTDYKLSLKGSYSKLDLCVQYRETDYDFVTRLMQDAGIFYYFLHEATKHSLVVMDEASSYASGEPIEFRTGEDTDSLLWWQTRHRLSPASVVNWGYDFEDPSLSLETKEKTKLKLGVQNGSELYDYVDLTQTHTVKVPDSKSNAVARIEAYEALAFVGEGKSDRPAFHAGQKFKLEKHPVDAEAGKEYAIVAIKHQATDPYDTQSLTDAAGGESAAEMSYSNQFECVPAKVPYRPMWTLPRPKIVGPHTAKVVGPNGSEIYADKYGRIRVQFHWDREGKSDEKSSCWLRVAQGWAGNKWGSFYYPRVGHEVLVDFIDGDPNRPIVTGSVYNADNMPPYDPTEKGYISGVKTQSADKGKAKNFNELSFSDKIGEEKIYFHAEKDFERVVENDDKLKIGFDTKDPGNQTIDIFNDRTVTIDKGKDSLQIKTGDRIAKIDKGNDTLTISKGNLKIAVAMGQVDVEAMKSITLKVGPSSIKIDQKSIVMKAMLIKAEAGLEALVTGTMVGVKGKAMVAIKGGMVKIN